MDWLQKTFSSVSHSWIEKCIETFKISPALQNFLCNSMHMWKTTLVLNTVENTMNAEDININNCIIQGDSLSPILFCVTLIPLSKLLNNTGYGYKIYDNTKKPSRLYGRLETLCKEWPTTSMPLKHCKTIQQWYLKGI